MCPPVETLHLIDDYPHYYDPLYFPHLHPSIFENSHNFCNWLASALNNHRLLCHRCPVLKNVCVFYDGMIISITCNARSVSISLQALQSARYRHCSVLLKITEHDPSNVSQSLLSKTSDLPSWFFYSPELLKLQLTPISMDNLLSSARGSGISGKICPKNFCIDALQSHILATRQRLCALSPEQLVAFLTLDPTDKETVSLHPSNHSLVSLVSSYFLHLYGMSIATSLQFSPVFVYSFHGNVRDANFTWLDCTLPELTQRLHSFSIDMLASIIRALPPYTLCPSINSRSRVKTAQGLVIHAIYRARFLLSVGSGVVADLYLAHFPSCSFTDHSDEHYVLRILQCEYSEVLCTALIDDSSKLDKRKRICREKRVETAIAAQQSSFQQYSNWPSVVSTENILRCLRRYYEGSKWVMPSTCAVCSQQLSDIQMFIVTLNSPLLHRLQHLCVRDPFVLRECITQSLSTAFFFDSPLINNLMLDRHGIVHVEVDSVKINLCRECHTTLANSKSVKIPRFAWANSLYRGDLPPFFSDLTWVEEKVCAKHCVTAHVTRLFQSNDPGQPCIFHGNTCTHDMNIISTASVLPRTPTDVNGLIGIVFLGPKPVNADDLGPIFRVRKGKMWAFLLWLVNNNHLYANIILDKDILALYPENGPLPGVVESVIHDHISNVPHIFHEETAGFDLHPASMLLESATSSDSDSRSDVIMIEKMGVSDPECDKFSGRSFTASALKNLYKSAASQKKPDLIVYRGLHPICEYNNPDLIPGCFPTLFPLGIRGFEIQDRPVPLSFQQQAAYYLNIRDKSFRYHNSFLFVCLNILQRRQAHLHTHFTVRKCHFTKVARSLTSVDPTVLHNLANRLEKEHTLSNLSAEEKNAMSLLKYVNTIAARIPGSHASKILVRNEICSYFGFFGLPHLFFTFNPNPAHSPIFQVIYGDSTVDLTSRFPRLVSARERAIRLAKDPVAAANFYEFSFRCCFEYLLGWDFKNSKSIDIGGIFGHLRAFYGSSEYTERGNLHGHFLIWLAGGANPSDIHKSLLDKSYQERFFSFFDDIIWHHLPDIELHVEKTFEPRVRRPPAPPDPYVPFHVMEEWESVMVTEIKKCGEILQCHVCAPVCHKYGNEGRCRFLFPHEIVEASYFDSDTNSVVLRCRDETMNNFNPYILVFCRHNHDLKCILSGKAAKAAMFYISDYITKMDTKTYEMLSLLSRAVARVPINSVGPKSPVDNARILLHKCLSQFSRQQQIHAQQAARYIRGFGDGIPSHKSVPMISSLLLSHVKNSIKVVSSAHPNGNNTDSASDDEDDDTEHSRIRLIVTENNKIVQTDQVHHYIYRADSLSHLCFYDFVRNVHIETKARDKRTKNTHKTRLGVLKHHILKDEHPLSTTHILIEHTDCLCGDGTNEYVPCIVGCSIPHKTNANMWALFALAHFKPFSASIPILRPGDDLIAVFNSYESFSDHANKVLQNWEAIHECEDEHDAECLRKQAQVSGNGHDRTNISNTRDDDDDINIALQPTTEMNCEWQRPNSGSPPLSMLSYRRSWSLTVP